MKSNELIQNCRETLAFSGQVNRKKFIIHNSSPIIAKIGKLNLKQKKSTLYSSIQTLANRRAFRVVVSFPWGDPYGRRFLNT